MQRKAIPKDCAAICTASRSWVTHVALTIIQTQAKRQGIDLFPDMKTGDEDAPNKGHEPKHIAVRVFLEHPDLFDAAADHMAMLTADRLHEYAGRERGVAIDLKAEKVEACVFHDMWPPVPRACGQSFHDMWPPP